MALDVIYTKFRCLYVHEGIGHLSAVPENVALTGSFLLDRYNGIAYILDTIKIHNWFEKITFESLHNML